MAGLVVTSAAAIALLMVWPAPPAMRAASAFQIGTPTPTPIPVRPIVFTGLVSPKAGITQIQTLEGGRTGQLAASTAIGYDSPNGVAVDKSGNLYVANPGTDTITVYSGGNFASPAAILGGPDTGLIDPRGVAIDPHGQLYVVTRNGILIFAKGASGDAAPTGSLGGPTTQLGYVASIAFDGAGQIYVQANPLSSSCCGQDLWVFVFPPGAKGNVAPRRVINTAIEGLGGGIAVDTQGDVFVPDESDDSVLEYGPRAAGNAPPIATISGPSTGFGFAVGQGSPLAVALDQAGNVNVLMVVWQTSVNASQISVFAAGVNGNVAPTRVIAGSLTGLYSSRALAVDAQGTTYVANIASAPSCPASFPPGNSVTVYPAGSSGNVAPSAVITRGDTGLDTCGGNQAFWVMNFKEPVGTNLAVDESGSLYVAQNGQIEVFAKGTVDAPPTTVIAGSNTGMLAGQSSGGGSVQGDQQGIAVDSQGNIYVLNETSEGSGPTRSLSAEVLEFAAGSSGNVAPTATISGPDTGLPQAASGGAYGFNSAGSAIAVDKSGDIYVAIASSTLQGNSQVYTGSILEFAPGSNGDAAPSAVISGSATGLNAPSGIAIDSRGNIYVADVLSDSVLVYASGSSGNVRPKQTIALKYLLQGMSPTGLALDSLSNIYLTLNNGGVEGLSAPSFASAIPPGRVPLYSINAGIAAFPPP